MKYKIFSVRIPNAVGLLLSTEIYIPERVGKLPAVILLHGFTGYKESKGLVDIADKLATQGIISIRFTSSGFGDSEGSLETDYRFSNYVLDAEYVYEYVKKLSYVDPNRIGTYGHSMGGKLAVFVCAKYSDIKACCIVSACVGFIGTMYESFFPTWEKVGYLEKISNRDGKKVRIPYAYVPDEESFDVLEAAHRIVCSQSLVIAGSIDTEVPRVETKKIYDALEGPKKFVCIDGLAHKYQDSPRVAIQMNTKIVNFFAKYL